LFGLVGRNGCGKSTLLRVIASEVEPLAGSVSVAGRLGWLRQEAGPADGTVAQALGIAADMSRIDRVLRGEGSAEDVGAADWTLGDRLRSALDRIGMKDVDLWRPLGCLSGGQRTRIALARTLLEAPDVLLMDEPTNNLDAEGRALVADLLRGRRGCVIVASHDRTLLGHVDAIVEIANGRATVFGGAWQEFAAARDARIDAAQRAIDLAERETRRAAMAAQAQRERQARRDSRGRADRAKGDTPKTVLDARQDRSERTSGRGNRIAERRQAQVATTLSGARAAVEVLAPLRILAPAVNPASETPALILEAVKIEIGMQPTLGPFDLVVGPVDRLALVGPNGSGKTTLLHLATGSLSPSEGRVQRAQCGVALLDQHVAFLHDDERLIDAMQRMNPTLSGNDAHAVLARFAFRKDLAEKRCDTLSGGERMRAGLACVLSAPNPPTLLLLDEPTNHMDIASIEVLEAAMRSYRGALVVASHDRAFLEGVGIERVVDLGQHRKFGTSQGRVSDVYR
jgi:ATPase subunit of ABC transporter with duplicated ATPase domains